MEFRGGAEGEGNLDSDGFKKLNEATKELMGESKPYSITGSLPLVGDLQEPCTGESIEILYAEVCKL